MKTSDLVGPTLDWAVAKCETASGRDNADTWLRDFRIRFGTRYSSVWSQAGPIIEREWISVYQVGNFIWKADIAGLHNSGPSPTPLIAAMRCYVASKLGDEIEIPEELK